MNHATLSVQSVENIRRAPLYPIVIIGLIQCLIAWLAAGWIESAEAFPYYLGAYFGMGAAYLTATFFVITRRFQTRRALWVILALALVMRAIFVPTAPTLSDDIFRYRWDGIVQRSGMNPYGLAPESPELAHLRDEHYEAINNKDLATIYPPVMEASFLLAATLSDSLAGVKWTFVASDLLLILLLLGLLKALKLPEERILVYAWCPLVLTEIASSGHNDVLALAFLVGAIWALQTSRPILAMVLIGVSGAAKFIAYFLVPLFTRTVRLKHFVWIAVVSIVVSTPYALSAPSMREVFDGLFNYASRWRSNDSVFHLLFWLTGSLNISKAIVGATLASFSIYLVVRNIEPVRSVYLVLGAILLLTATIHPWYVVWIVPFLCIYPSSAWLSFTVTVALGYHSGYLSTPGLPWEDSVWIKCLEYAPIYGLGLWTWLKSDGRDSSLVSRGSLPYAEPTRNESRVTR